MILLHKTENATVTFLIWTLCIRKFGTNLESTRLNLQITNEYRKDFQRVIWYALSKYRKFPGI